MTTKQTVSIESQDALRGVGWFHEVDHSLDTPVLVQAFDVRGYLMPLPGVGSAVRQRYERVTIPVVSPDYYPIMVVIIG